MMEGRYPPKLVSLGFAVPDHYVYSQEQVLERLGWTAPLSRRIFASTGIRKRHFAVDPVGKSWQELREAYRPLALKLSLQAVIQCLDNRLNPADLGCLVFCSVTDYSTPALGYYIGRELMVNQNTSFCNILGQGCQSALPGLKRAYDYFMLHQRPALVVNTELCSTTFYPGDEADLELVTTNALFADSSSAAFVAWDEDPRHPYLIDFVSRYDPRYLDILGYTWVDGRLKCRLDRSVPQVIPELLADALSYLLSRNRLTVKDIRYWCIHPGGPAVLRRIEQLLGLTREQTWASWETMAEYGNVSSATLAMIAKRLQGAITDFEGYAVGVTMGAGGSIEAALLSYRN